MKRIILHWTGGAYNPNSLDLEHYHFIIDGNGVEHTGKFKPEANLRPRPGRYAAHTLRCNTGSIGVAVAAMGGATEAPYNPGPFPIRAVQVSAVARLCADLAKQYGIPVSRTTILTHAEVQPTLKIRQRAKWDIRVLPGMKSPGDPIAVGDTLRARISEELERGKE
jgi:N-acetyl-anhydromuramyl-L-alanine amidase AmpD